MSDPTEGREGDRGDDGMHAAVAEFLAGADDVYGEYDQGYMDADAALSVLSSRIDDLREAADEADEVDGADEADDSDT